MTAIYLISPPKIDEKTFYNKLEELLSTGLVANFQLRLKDSNNNQPSNAEIARILAKILPICRKNNVCLTLNDNIELALELTEGLACDGLNSKDLHLDGGLHLGGEDLQQLVTASNNKENPKYLHCNSIIKNLKEKIAIGNIKLGVSCYDSQELAHFANSFGAEIISFGAFFPTQTKIAKAKPHPSIISWAKQEFPTKKITAIGGIDANNISLLPCHDLDYIAIIGTIWQAESPLQSLITISKSLKRIS
jgi:thiamine-phosphate pyrophosphorylase